MSFDEKNLSILMTQVGISLPAARPSMPAYLLAFLAAD